MPGAKRPLMTKSLQLGLWGNHGAKLLLSKLEQEKAVRKRRGKMEVLCWKAGVMCEMIFFYFLFFAKFVEQLRIREKLQRLDGKVVMRKHRSWVSNAWPKVHFFYDLLYPPSLSPPPVGRN